MKLIIKPAKIIDVTDPKIQDFIDQLNRQETRIAKVHKLQDFIDQLNRQGSDEVSDGGGDDAQS